MRIVGLGSVGHWRHGHKNRASGVMEGSISGSLIALETVSGSVDKVGILEDMDKG